MAAIKTFRFGTIDVGEDKIITFPQGLLGFPDLKNFTLLREESDKPASLLYMQSLDRSDVALTVVDPLLVTDEYSPTIINEDVADVEDLTKDNLMVLVTMTIPEDITKISVNLQAPIIINTDTNKATQVIIEDKKYAIKHPIYEYLKAKKEKEEK